MREETIGNRIKELREQHGITQLQLAEMMNVSRSTVANWETETRLPDIGMVKLLAACLGVTVSDIVDEKKEPGKPVILVVDDLQVLLDGFVRMLRRELPEAEVKGFATGREALSYARQETASIAFLDIELGEEDGIALGRQLTELNPRINIIFLTSHSDYMQAALNDHCSGYILKPLTPDKLRHEISHLRCPVRGLRG